MDKEKKKDIIVTHDQACDMALNHYLECVAETGRWQMLIVQAILFYKLHGRQEAGQ